MDELADLMRGADQGLQELVTRYELVEAAYRQATLLQVPVTQAVGTGTLPRSPIITTTTAR